MKIGDRNFYFLISILIAVGIAWILTMIQVWQLVIIAGIVAGLLNKNMTRGTLSGMLGVCIYWAIFMIYGSITKNTFALINIFGSILGISGWIIITIVLLVGALLGALGGAIGSGVMMIIKESETTKTSQ